MKTITPLIISLVLSLTLAGQALALQSTIPLNGLNKALQTKIDTQLIYFLDDERDFYEKVDFFQLQNLDETEDSQPEISSEPDCPCHLYTRIM
jgi:hypothetical protein